MVVRNDRPIEGEQTGRDENRQRERRRANSQQESRQEWEKQISRKQEGRYANDADLMRADRQK